MAHDECPSPGALLTHGERPDPDVARHLAVCTACRNRLRDVQEILVLTARELQHEDEPAVAARHARFDARLRHAVADMTREGEPTRAPARWRPWILAPTGMAVLAVGVIAAWHLTAVAFTLQRALQVDARAGRLYVRALPVDPPLRVAGCEPWESVLPVARSPRVPAVAFDLLADFFVASDVISPHETLSASFAAWRKRRGAWWPRDQVADDAHVRVVSTSGTAGPVERADLTVRQDDGGAVRVGLEGRGCRVVITPGER